MNNITLEGNIGKEVTRKAIPTKSGEDMTIVEFSLAATNRVNGKIDKDNPMWVNVKVLGDYAEDVYAMLQEDKKTMILVHGSLSEENWESKDGDPRSKRVVTATDVARSARFMSSDGFKADSGGSSSDENVSSSDENDDEEEAF